MNRTEFGEELRQDVIWELGNEKEKKRLKWYTPRWHVEVFSELGGGEGGRLSLFWRGDSWVQKGG